MSCQSANNRLRIDQEIEKKRYRCRERERDCNYELERRRRSTQVTKDVNAEKVRERDAISEKRK